LLIAQKPLPARTIARPPRYGMMTKNHKISANDFATYQRGTLSINFGHNVRIQAEGATVVVTGGKPLL
jgi:hypothetical protein